jgi:hypothetical protein
LIVNGPPAEALDTEIQAVKLNPENPDIQARLAHFREAAERPIFSSAKP